MRSLRLKLITTFLLVSIAGTAITTIIFRLSSVRAFDTLLQEQEEADFIEFILSFYEDTGSLQDIEHTLQNQFQEPPSFAMADDNGRIVIPNPQYPPEKIMDSEVLSRGIPVELDGKLIGTVLPANQPPPKNPEEEAFIRNTNQALLIGGLGATTVALLLAAVMTRTLTRPIRDMSLASRKMAQGDLQQSVPIRTQDELGELARTFNQMSAELDRVNKIRRQMTADVAHDLRTPLTVLSGYLELMEDGLLAPTPERFALMRQEIDSLERLVADLNILSLSDSGNLILQREPVDLHEFLHHVQDTFAQQAARQNISIHVNADETLQNMELDTARMQRILGNLVSNALQHTPSSGVITLTAGLAADDHVQITVSDTGSGIHPDDIPYIFSRFYRGDRSRHEGNGGSGLGLAIARSLVTAHGGTISAASSPDEGTTFTILLPAAS